jgi:Mrp family chromosome partitioning ATPase
VLDEPFSLSQVYAPLNAYYSDTQKRSDSIDALDTTRRSGKRCVIDLEKELVAWAAERSPTEPIRVISGGPGSGKSTFARIFAAALSRKGPIRVLFVPLHLIDPTRDLVDEVGRFVRDEAILPHNPLDPEANEPNLLVILAHRGFEWV